MEPGKNSPLLTIVPDGWDFFREILEELVVKAGEAGKMLNSANTFGDLQSSLWPLKPSWSHQVLLERWYNPDILWRDQRPFEAVLFKTAYICWWQRSTSRVSVCLCYKYVTKKPLEQLLSFSSESIEIKQGNAYIRSNKQILRGAICGLQDCLLLFWTALCFFQV